MNSQVPVKSTSSSTGDTRLHGHWLLFMRIAWSLLVLFSLAVFVTSLPVYFVLSQTICIGTACTDWQISMESAKTLQALWLPLYVLLWFIVFLSLAGAQLYRYFRISNPLQRQQTKWVVFSLAIVLLLVLGGFLPILFSPSLGQKGSLYQAFSSTFGNFLLILIPLSLAIAILRYRLWDVDVLINKTLVYGTLTATLALIYIGLVIGLQALLRGIISQDNSVAIVVSTLAIAALFQPLRTRIQAIIYRRFYRRKYDATRTLAAFSATLRNEVDLDQLREQLVAVVQETMQPAHVSLWLRKSDRKANRETWGVHPLSAHTEQ